MSNYHQRPVQQPMYPQQPVQQPMQQPMQQQRVFTEEEVRIMLAQQQQQMQQPVQQPMQQPMQQRPLYPQRQTPFQQQQQTPAAFGTPAPQAGQQPASTPSRERRKRNSTVTQPSQQPTQQQQVEEPTKPAGIKLLLEPGIISDQEHYTTDIKVQGVSLMDNLKEVTGELGEVPYPSRDIAGDAGYAELCKAASESEVDGAVHRMTSRSVFWVPPGTKSALVKGFNTIEGLVDAIVTDDSLHNPMARYVDKLLTLWVNGVLLTFDDMDGISIDSFKSDITELIKYLKNNDMLSVLQRVESGILQFIKIVKIGVCEDGVDLTLPELNIALTREVVMNGIEPYTLTKSTAPTVFSVIEEGIKDGRLCYVLTDECKRLACMSNDNEVIVLNAM